MKVYIQIGTNTGNDLFRQKVLSEKPDMTVLIEPLPFLIPEIEKNYIGIQNVIIINRAIHYENNKKVVLYKPCIGKIDGNISENGITYNDFHYSLVPMNDWGSKQNMKEVEATTINFNTLCNDLYINEIDYLQIDTEGFDTEIIKMIDFNKINIKTLRYEKWGFSTDCFTRYNEQKASELGKQGMIDVENKLRSLGYILQDINDQDGADILATKINTPKISLCIPTYNRFDTFLSKNIPKYLENPYIDEIIISDEDGNDIEKIKREFPNENKLKLFKNDFCMGPFRNKDKAVSYASNEWVCLMDSDNFAPEVYFIAWLNYIKTNGIHKKNVYLPIQTVPQPNHGGFNYTEFQGIILEKSNVRNNNIERMGCMLNTGNYIFHRDNFLETKAIMPELHSKLDVQDVFFKNALLLINNSKLIVVPNMMYDHIVHDGSFFTNNVSNFQNAHNIILSIYNNM